MAVALPLGVAVGRIGDVINGEHYGPPTDFFLGVRNTHPDASVPSPDVAYHSGGLYDLIIALAVFVAAWPLRNRLRRPTVSSGLSSGCSAPDGSLSSSSVQTASPPRSASAARNGQALL
jgi:prolipoprotein diacylglyceryltransferase